MSAVRIRCSDSGDEDRRHFETRAVALLKDHEAYICFVDARTVCLDGDFNLQDLTALVEIMRTMPSMQKDPSPAAGPGLLDDHAPPDERARVSLQFAAEIDRKIVGNPPAPPKTYKCKTCGHVSTEGDMDANAYTNEDPERWSNWICPKCESWPTSLADGWDEVVQT